MHTQYNKNFGKQGELDAKEYLVKKGYTILNLNWTCRYGEIDIVALDNNVLVFIEVKTRYSDKYGTPEEAITPWKLRSVIRAGEYYALTHPYLPEELRIDFVGVEYHNGSLKRINLIKSITE